jgi:aldose 1-epimerase
VNADAASVTFWRLSPDGEGGFPGALGVAVTYTLTAAGTIVLDYEARAHASTVVNLTQHTYFNLSGDGQRDAREHELTIHADRFIPVERDRLPVGTLAPVKSTPFDFRAPASIGGRLDLHHSQLDAAGGFDHTWALPSGLKGELVPAARLHDPRSGRTLAISTTEPGLQFYDGHLLGIAPGDAGSTFHPFAGVCLETQHYPDSPNRPDFPTTVVRPGRPYRSTTTWQLGIE